MCIYFVPSVDIFNRKIKYLSVAMRVVGSTDEAESQTEEDHHQG